MTDLASSATAVSPQVAASSLSADELRRRGDRVAVIGVDGRRTRELSFADLADRVEIRRSELGDSRRLVLLAGTNDLETVVTLLAALDGGHPLMLADPDRTVDSLAAEYGPDTVVRCRDGRAVLDHRTTPFSPSPHDMHPDLALLLSTSGTSGGAKLVRLSASAVHANARAIAEALDLSESDRTITTLPLHYCYGLSVITSHLTAGASVVLTGTAVVDPCFWTAVAMCEVTTIAGVPYTFEMIDRLGLEALRVPSLRLLTQAGGRMDPEMVRRLTDLGDRTGWGLAVMYGQTEATARMAVSSPAETRRFPDSVGRAIPGGALRIDGGGPGGVGEVVYSGPNVMMGYAYGPSDLSRGHDLDELRTGDLGRLDPDGRLRLVGRVSRFVKIHGKRVDLDDLERSLSTPDRTVRCAGDDDGIVAATESGTPDELDPSLLAEVSGTVSVPPGRLVAARLESIPRTSSGKVDGPTMMARTRALVSSPAPEPGDESVPDAFAVVLGVDVVDRTASFADLGGDSFSYVEMSVRLERLIGDLPKDWHLTPIAELERRRRRPSAASTLWTRVDTSVVIRAIAILLIVCTHMRVFRVPGGAHGLLAVVGYNIARFQLSPRDVPGRFRRSLATVARVAVPTSAWIALNIALVGGYSVGAMLLVNNYTGDAARRGGRWEYWYFEAFVQVTIVVAVVFAIPVVRRIERRGPFAFAIAVLALTLVVRFDLVQLGGDYNEMFRTHTVACFVALGWCAQRAASTAQRIAVTALAIVTTFGYFGQFDREWRIVLMIAALIWLPTVVLPRVAVLVLTPVAAASMWIFLVHWQVWPLYTPWMHNGLAYWFTIATGVGVWWTIRRAGELRPTWAPPRWDQARSMGRSTRTEVNDADTPIRRSEATPVSA